MKVSVSLPDEAIEFIDHYAHQRGVASRSAVIKRAVELLRATELGAAYADAWNEWEQSDENTAWDATVGDGLPTTT